MYLVSLLYGKYLHKNINIEDDIFKIGTEINEVFLNRAY